MTSSEVAAWVQAIGSILAIAGALGAALWQAQVQHRNALTLFAMQQRHSRAELGRTLVALAENCARAIAHMTAHFSTRQLVHDVAEGRAPLDRGELERLDTALRSIPLHDLPGTLVTPTMVVSGVVRQFRERVELAIRAHRIMHSEEFAGLFQVLEEMNKSLRATVADIAVIVKRIENEEQSN